MNRYPLWVYVTIGVALVLGALYTLPNFFGEVPAVQVSPARATLKVDSAALGRVEESLKKAGIQPTGISLELASIKVRLADTDTQLQATCARSCATRTCVTPESRAKATAS